GLESAPLAQLRGNLIENGLEAGAQLWSPGLRLDQAEPGTLRLGGDQVRQRAKTGRDLLGPGEPAGRRVACRSRQILRAAFDRSVEGGDKAGFLAFEELVEGDRGDAGCLDDRLDRG